MSAEATGEAVSTTTFGSAGEGQSLNKFCIASVAFRRAKQLQSGARPRVDAGNHKILRVAHLEVLAGLVSWDLTPPV